MYFKRLLNDLNVSRKLTENLNRCVVMLEDDMPMFSSLPERHVKKKRRIGRELKMKNGIRTCYEMKDV